jgi:hypothetical protein
MFARARTFLTIAALTLTMPAVAQAPAPTTTPFDGTYAGVSLGTSSFMQGISAAQWCASTRGAPASVNDHKWRRSVATRRELGRVCEPARGLGDAERTVHSGRRPD